MGFVIKGINFNYQNSPLWNIDYLLLVTKISGNEKIRKWSDILEFINYLILAI